MRLFLDTPIYPGYRRAEHPLLGISISFLRGLPLRISLAGPGKMRPTSKSILSWRKALNAPEIGGEIKAMSRGIMQIYARINRIVSHRPECGPIFNLCTTLPGCDVLLIWIWGFATNRVWHNAFHHFWIRRSLHRRPQKIPRKLHSLISRRPTSDSRFATRPIEITL